MAGLGWVEYIKLVIFYASWLAFPMAALMLWVIITRRNFQRYAAIGMILALTVFSYARFIEPRLLTTKNHQVTLEKCFAQSGQIKLAIFSDTHNGLFSNAMPINRIINAINKNNPDAVLIAGDLVYFLDPKRYAKTYSTFAKSNAPVYAVLGNHDVGVPGPDMTKELTEFLPNVSVQIIDNKATMIANNYDLIGLSDSWSDKKQGTELLAKPGTNPRIVLTHNPKTIRILKKGSFDLLIAGHTHGGQVNLPIITCWFTFACDTKRYGYKSLPKGPIFVTSGTGMVGLPIRFNVPPRVDFLTLTHKAC